MDTDLLGDPLTVSVYGARVRTTKGKQWGYVMPPGTGPAGHTCGDCQHILRERRWRKCKLNRARWTNSYATDVLARSPACAKWQQEGVTS